MLLLVAVALAAPLPPYAYSHPTAASEDDLTSYTFPKWPVRTTVYAASGEVAVYDAVGGKSLGLIPFGQALRVEEVGASATVADKVDAWYRVSGPKNGWVHGGDLTPYRWEVDLDGDGEKEVATATWLGDFTVRVRVFEPSVSAGGVMQLDVDAAGGGYLSQNGAELQAEIVPYSTAGIAMIHLHLGVEACADFRDDWISYTSEGAGRIGTEHVALSLAGLSDPPNSSTFEVAFSGKRKTAYVTRTTAKGDASAKPTNDVATTRYVLRDGLYLVEKDGEVQRE